MRLSAGILPLLCFLPLALAVPQKRQLESGDKYLLGVGKADVTGPVVELGFVRSRIIICAEALLMCVV